VWRDGARTGIKMAKSAAIEPVHDDRLAAIKAWPQRAKSFYNDVRTEMKKVTTPSRKEVQGTTTVVVITVFLFAAYFWLIDTIIGKTLDQALRNMAHR
jgi:preprotein translocase subunit SecE